MNQLKKILLNLDSSKESQNALVSAITLAKISGGAIIAVNIVNQTVVTNLARHSEKSLAEVEVELEENGWHYLYAAEEQAKNEGAHIVILQENGYPEEILPRLAKNYSADMIIIGQNKKNRENISQSRTADQIIEHAACAVLIIK